MKREILAAIKNLEGESYDLVLAELSKAEKADELKEKLGLQNLSFEEITSSRDKEISDLNKQLKTYEKQVSDLTTTNEAMSLEKQGLLIEQAKAAAYKTLGKNFDREKFEASELYKLLTFSLDEDGKLSNSEFFTQKNESLLPFFEKPEQVTQPSETDTMEETIVTWDDIL